MTEDMSHLMAWATGRPGPGRVVVLEDSSHVREVEEMLGAEADGPSHVIFAPEGQAGSRGRVVGYGGSFRACNSEASLGEDFYLQVQNYSISQYVSVMGPTLVRIADDADFEVWLADADTAREKGEFAEFLANPTLLLADLPGLGAPLDGAGPRHRLYVRTDGKVTVSPYGSALGTLGVGLKDLDAAWQQANATSAHPCAVTLATAVPETQRAAALEARPWLGEYVLALDALRNLRARGVLRPRVSGFGGRLRPETSVGDHPRAQARHLVLWTDESAYLYTSDGSRVFELNRAAGELAELLLCQGSVDAAAQHAPRPALVRVQQFFERVGVSL
ncbi:hypothetical protein GCM10010430_02730 [Kitasatospora cystarginea]|uniref:Uncharacterized protein n=1 Tax=Kitasatospora cystarginea TaxID=58350 RepID=A0ABN3DCF2_9ACTN